MRAAATVTVEIDEKPVKVLLDCQVNFHYSPGNTYGPPEFCEPPEGELEVIKATVDAIDFADAHEPTDAEYEAAQKAVNDRLCKDTWDELESQLWDRCVEQFHEGPEYD